MSRRCFLYGSMLTPPPDYLESSLPIINFRNLLDPLLIVTHFPPFIIGFRVFKKNWINEICTWWLSLSDQTWWQTSFGSPSPPPLKSYFVCHWLLPFLDLNHHELCPNRECFFLLNIRFVELFTKYKRKLLVFCSKNIIMRNFFILYFEYLLFLLEHYLLFSVIVCMIHDITFFISSLRH